MPGNIADTSLARHMDMQQVADFIAAGELALPPQKTVEQGAATSVLLAASPTVEGITGRYFEDCAQSEPVTERAGAVAGCRTVRPGPGERGPAVGRVRGSRPLELHASSRLPT